MRPLRAQSLIPRLPSASPPWLITGACQSPAEPTIAEGSPDGSAPAADLAMSPSGCGIAARTRSA